MRKNVYCIYDQVSEIYMPPFLEMNEGTCRRMIKEAHAQKQSGIAEHVEDLHLYSIGYYNDNTGLIDSHPTGVLRVDSVANIVRSIDIDPAAKDS
mgnify:CR=1 FL=1